jgi:hypothetical protein
VGEVRCGDERFDIGQIRNIGWRNVSPHTGNGEPDIDAIGIFFSWMGLAGMIKVVE